MSDATVSGFDYREGRAVEFPRPFWRERIALALRAGGRVGRDPDGTVACYGRDGKRLFEVYDPTGRVRPRREAVVV